MNSTTTGGGHTEVDSDDAESTSGIQRITADGAKTTVIVVGTATYLTGDRAALINYYGFDAATATQVAGKWLSLSPGDPGYSDVSEAVTLKSALDELNIVGPLTKLPAQIRHGVRVIGFKGTPAATDAPAGSTATLWIAASGKPYPVEWDATTPGATAAAAKNTIVATMSGWGRPLVITAPADAIPLSSGENT